MIKVLKRGFIAKVYEKCVTCYPYSLPDAAPYVAELSTYPYFWFLEKERVFNFIKLLKDDGGENLGYFYAVETLIGEKAWGQILKAFDGIQPDLLVAYDKNAKAEDFFVKFRIVYHDGIVYTTPMKCDVPSKYFTASMPEGSNNSR